MEQSKEELRRKRDNAICLRYYHKRAAKDPEYVEKMREKARERYYKKKALMALLPPEEQKPKRGVGRPRKYVSTA